MARPLNSGTVDKDVSRSLRRRLAMTTMLAVAPFPGYGRQAYASRIPSSGTIFICSGTSAGEDFTVNNADFRTAAAPLFEVTTNGVALDGFSAQSSEGWSSFLRGNYTFASDYDDFSGNAGIRYAW